MNPLPKIRPNGKPQITGHRLDSVGVCLWTVIVINKDV